MIKMMKDADVANVMKCISNKKRLTVIIPVSLSYLVTPEGLEPPTS